MNMHMHRRFIGGIAAATVLLSGCTAIPQQSAVKEVQVCQAAECTPAARQYSEEQLLAGLQGLFKENAGEKVTVCSSDPKSRTCKSVGICQFVLGGILPGNGCSKSMVFSEIAPGEQAGQLDLKAHMPLTFIWTPVICAATKATLVVRSPDQISLEFQPRFCSWMVVGNMRATFNLAIDAIDLRRGEIAGYWSHAVTGTGNGRGSGYTVLKFPKAMPDGVSWLAARAAPATVDNH